MSPLPAWQRDRLAAQGLMDRDTGAVRRARATFCARCNGHVMRGLDAHWGSLARDVDPYPLTRKGEVMALLSGRRTFSLRWLYDHYEIDTRDHFVIAGEPAGSIPNVDVVVGHECGRVLEPPLVLHEPGTKRYRRVDTVHLPDDPPF